MQRRDRAVLLQPLVAEDEQPPGVECRQRRLERLFRLDAWQVEDAALLGRLDGVGPHPVEIEPRDLGPAGQDGLEFENRAQFFGLAAQVMRSILVDHARSRSAAKRGGGGVPLTLQDHLAVAPGQTTDILALHEALEALAQQDDRKARIIEMRYFAGMTTQEIADATETSVATVGREIRVAHAWLLRRMRQ